MGRASERFAGDFSTAYRLSLLICVSIAHIFSYLLAANTPRQQDPQLGFVYLAHLSLSLVHRSCHSPFIVILSSVLPSLFLHHQRSIIACYCQRHILQSLTHFDRPSGRSPWLDHPVKGFIDTIVPPRRSLAARVDSRAHGRGWLAKVCRGLLPPCSPRSPDRQTSRVFTFRSTRAWPCWRTWSSMARWDLIK